MPISKASSNAVAPAAKGDLVVGTTTNDSGILGVGSNGETLVADSSTSTGLRWQGNFAAGKNKIINGDFGINQRAFSSTTTSGTYGFDRWTYLYSSGTTTYSAQTFTPGTAPVAGYEGINFARCVTSGQTGAAGFNFFYQPIEDVRTLANQTATVSFWAKASTGTPKVAIEFLQNFGSGGSGAVTTYAGQITLSTSWTRYTVTATVPSVSGKTIGTSSYLGLVLWTSAGTDYNARTGSMGLQNTTIDFWGVQVEAGSVATAFQTATGTLAGELAACQRYYYRMTGGGSVPLLTTNGISWSTTRSNIIIQNPVRMRTTPTLIEFANLNATDLVNYNLAVSGLTIDTLCSTPDFFFFDATHAATATVNRQAFLRGSSSAGYIGVGAEL